MNPQDVRMNTVIVKRMGRQVLMVVEVDEDEAMTIATELANDELRIKLGIYEMGVTALHDYLSVEDDRCWFTIGESVYSYTVQQRPCSANPMVGP